MIEWDDVDEQLNHVHTETFYPFYFLPALADKRGASISIFSLLGVGDKKSLISRKEKRNVVWLQSQVGDGVWFVCFHVGLACSWVAVCMPTNGIKASQLEVDPMGSPFA